MNRKIFNIPIRLILELMNPGVKIIVPTDDGSTVVMTPNTIAPKGANPVAAHADLFRKCISVAIEHESFEETPCGDVLPMVYCETMYEYFPPGAEIKGVDSPVTVCQSL